jgi:hypothetical protein
VSAKIKLEYTKENKGEENQTISMLILLLTMADRQRSQKR